MTRTKKVTEESRNIHDAVNTLEQVMADDKAKEADSERKIAEMVKVQKEAEAYTELIKKQFGGMADKLNTYIAFRVDGVNTRAELSYTVQAAAARYAISGSYDDKIELKIAKEDLKAARAPWVLTDSDRQLNKDYKAFKISAVKAWLDREGVIDPSDELIKELITAAGGFQIEKVSSDREFFRTGKMAVTGAPAPAKVMIAHLADKWYAAGCYCGTIEWCRAAKVRHTPKVK